MKFFIYTILSALPVFLPAFLLAQDGIFWSDPVTVAESSFGDDSPGIALLSDGTPIILWGKAGINASIYISRLENGAFTAPQGLNTNGIGPDIYGFGGLDLATSGDRVYIVFENFTDGIFLLRSADGGENFELPVNVFDPPPGDWATLPSVAADDNGNPLVSVIRELTNETQARYIMMRSDDGGASFQAPVVASEPAPGDYVCECCPSDIHISGDDVWLIYRNNNNNLRDMWVSHSPDNGTSFVSATDVDDTDWMISACPISGPKMAPLAGDSLITTWMSGASGAARVSFSTLHGQTMEKGWESEFPRINDNGQQRRPAIAGSNDTIGVVWEESGFGINGTDLIFAFSKTGAAGLTSNIVNLTDVIGNQNYPALAYANGYFHLVYSGAGGSLEYRKGTVSEINNTAQEKTPSDDLVIYPSPVKNGLVHLSMDESLAGSIALDLLNSRGQVVKQFPLKQYTGGQVITLDVSDLSTGLYFLRARSGQYSATGKLIIQGI